MAGIVAYGVYIPSSRLDRAEITATLGSGGGKGTRAVASFDENTTTMGVEAARAVMRAAPDGAEPASVLFATADPAYLDKANATVIHAALGFDPSVFAADMAGSVRSGLAAVRAALDAHRPTLVVLSDMRRGMPGGVDEAAGGDGAAALLFGDGPVLAELVASADGTGEILDRWRLPGDPVSRVWEERFGEHAYVPLAERAVADALKAAGITAAEVDHLVVTGVHARSARTVSRSVGTAPEALVRDLSEQIGVTGTAHLWILLGDVLDRAQPGDTILAVLIGDGASALVLRATSELPSFRARQPQTVAAAISTGTAFVRYPTFLTWRDELRREPPRRPDPQAPAAPPSYRREAWKFAFSASRCEECGTRHLPPGPVCLRCGAVERMANERLADTPATIATFTVDRLAFSLSPPVVAAVVDFDGGGRFRCQLTDVDPDSVAIGDRVEMTFRKISTVQGVHNYFWKARPAREGADAGTGA